MPIWAGRGVHALETGTTGFKPRAQSSRLLVRGNKMGDRKEGSRVWREEATKRVKKVDRAMEWGGMSLNFEGMGCGHLRSPARRDTERAPRSSSHRAAGTSKIHESYPKWQDCCFHSGSGVLQRITEGIWVTVLLHRSIFQKAVTRQQKLV